MSQHPAAKDQILTSTFSAAEIDAKRVTETPKGSAEVTVLAEIKEQKASTSEQDDSEGGKGVGEMSL